MKKLKDISEDDLEFSKKLPFRVPESYFEELPRRIQERVSGEPAPARTIRLLHPRLAYAAMIIVLIAVGYQGMKFVTHRTYKDALTADEIADAIDYYAYHFDDAMFISTLDESDLDYYAVETDEETEDFIQYLSEDYIDFSEYMSDY